MASLGFGICLLHEEMDNSEWKRTSLPKDEQVTGIVEIICGSGLIFIFLSSLLLTTAFGVQGFYKFLTNNKTYIPI